GSQLFRRYTLYSFKKNIAFPDRLVDGAPGLSVYIGVIGRGKGIRIPKGGKRSLEHPLRALRLVSKRRTVNVGEYARVVARIQVAPNPVLGFEQLIKRRAPVVFELQQLIAGGGKTCHERNYQEDNISFHYHRLLEFYT